MLATSKLKQETSKPNLIVTHFLPRGHAYFNEATPPERASPYELWRSNTFKLPQVWSSSTFWRFWRLAFAQVWRGPHGKWQEQTRGNGTQMDHERAFYRAKLPSSSLLWFYESVSCSLGWNYFFISYSFICWLLLPSIVLAVGATAPRALRVVSKHSTAETHLHPVGLLL